MTKSKIEYFVSRDNYLSKSSNNGGVEKITGGVNASF